MKPAPRMSRGPRPGQAGRSRAAAAREALVWLALAAALSPVLVDLARHLRDEPAARTCAVFFVLFLRLALRQRDRSPPRRDGLLWAGAGLALTVLAVGGGVTRFARLALPLCIVGVARRMGRPPLAAALLTLWCVPLPSFISQAVSPWLEASLLRLAAAPLSAFGTDLVLEEGRARLDGETLALGPADTGLPLGVLLSGLGYYAAALQGDRIPAAFARALRWALLGPALQLLALGLALLALAAGAGEAARVLLAPGLWVLAALVGVVHAERR